MKKRLTIALLFATLSSVAEDKGNEKYYYYYQMNYQKELEENNDEGTVIRGYVSKILQYCDPQLPIIGWHFDTTCFRNSKPFKPTINLKNLSLDDRDDDSNYYYFENGEFTKKMKNNTKPGDVLFSEAGYILHYCDLKLPIIGFDTHVVCFRNDKPFKPTVKIEKKVKDKIKLR
jgi:hypothetical protein